MINLTSLKHTATLFIVFIFSVDTIVAQKSGYTISAHIQGTPDGIEYFLRKNNEKGGTDTVARGTVVNSKLTISGIVVEPELHFLFLKDQKEYFPLLLENDKFTIVGNFTEWPRMKVDGPSQNREYHEIKAILNKQLDKSNAFKEDIIKYSKNLADTPHLRKAYKDREIALSVYYSETLPMVIKSHPNNLYTAFLIDKQVNTTVSEKIKLYASLTPFVQQSKYGRDLIKNVRLKEKSEAAIASNLAPDFSLPELKTGTLISLRKFSSHSKYTYVDFWASWCKPCRAQFPKLKEIYEQYKDKGFAVLGVSIDKDGDSWKKAVEEDNISWPNVSDLKGTQSEVAVLYSLVSIPRSILIDEHGKVIARNLHGEKLEMKLKELLGK